jgi:hypothetical protein
MQFTLMQSCAAVQGWHADAGCRCDAPPRPPCRRLAAAWGWRPRCCCFSVLLPPIPAAVAAAPAQPGRCSRSTACMPSAVRPGAPAGPLRRCPALVLASPLPGPTAVFALATSATLAHCPSYCWGVSVLLRSSIVMPVSTLCFPFTAYPAPHCQQGPARRAQAREPSIRSFLASQRIGQHSHTWVVRCGRLGALRAPNALQSGTKCSRCRGSLLLEDGNHGLESHCWPTAPSCRWEEATASAAAAVTRCLPALPATCRPTQPPRPPVLPSAVGHAAA